MTMSARAHFLFILANLPSCSYIYASNSYLLHLHFKNMHSDMFAHSNKVRLRRMPPKPRNAYYIRSTRRPFALRLYGTFRF